MSFTKYPAYKDSGVTWLGDIPAHWHVRKFRYVFDESPEKITEEVVGDMLSVSGYRGIEVKQYDDEGRRRTDDELFGYRVVRPGQLVVNTMWLNYAGLGVSEYEGHVSPAYRSYWIDSEVDKRFIHHLMRSGTYVQGYTQLLTGVRPNSLQMGRDDLMVFPVLLPTKSEQAQIARFLDHDIARIDALIEEQQRLIELLKEKRQAVISHTVTKGLDPTVAMKNSGVEWLGEVPAHWVVSRVKNVTSFITSGSRGWSDYIDESGEDIFLQSGDMDNRLNVLFDKAKRIITPEGAEGVRTRLQDGDVVVCITGANTGRVAVVGKVCKAAYVNQHLGLVRPYVLACNSRYLGYALSSSACQTYFNIEQYGLKEGLSLTDIAEAPLMVPPLAEQVKLVEVIENHLVNLDGLTRDSEMIVELLQERRASLISSAVTGKIDVRGWQPPAHAPSLKLAREAV